jgi:hypothetical protein
MSSQTKRGVNAAPVVDEWGFYDPSRAGLAAVMDRLEEKGTAPPSPSGSRIVIASLREAADLRNKK